MSTSRKTLLAGASAAAFTLVIGGAAFAADVTVPTTTGASNTVDGHVAVNSLLVNQIASANAHQTNPAFVAIPTGTGDTVTVNTNTAAAVTTGNSLIDNVDFDTTSSGTGTSTGSGIGVLGMSLNLGGQFTASTTNGTDANAINGGATGTYQVDTNTTQASTTLNSTSISVNPTGVPLNFASASVGGISSLYPNSPNVATTGDITSVNAQGNELAADASGSQSLLSGNSASLTVGQTTAQNGNNVGIGGSEDISDNAMSALFTENSETNSVAATGGELPSLQGSITVANVQANVDTGTVSNGLAYATGNSVTAVISGNANTTGTTATETLTGGLTENSNSIDASVTGNSAQPSTGTGPGNSITLTGVNFADPGAQTQANSIQFPGTGTVTSTDGGLALLNSQTQETNGAPAAHLTSQNTGSTISSTVQNATTGASSSVDSNSITTESTADTASNAISVTGGDTINGTVSLGSAQEANHQLIYADGVNGTVRSYLGYAAGPNDIVTGTTATADSNTVGVSAVGETVTNALTLDASSVTSGSSTIALSGQHNSAAAQLFSASNGGGGATAGGATVNNVQSVFGADSTITAANTDGYVDFRAGGNAAALTGDTFSADSNTIQAIAEGAIGASSASVSGNSGVQASSFSGGLGVLNAQTDEAAVAAATTTYGVTMNLAYGGVGGANVGATGTGNGSSVDNSNNVLRALAYGTQATANTASVDAGATTVAAGTGDSTSLTVTPGDALGLPFDHTTSVTVDGGVAVYSDQATTGDVSASTLSGDQPIYIFVGNDAGVGDVINSSTTQVGNAFLSAARGNVASDNAVTLTGDSITTAGGGQGPIATLANVQSLGTGVDITAVTDTSLTPTAPGTSAVQPTVQTDISGSLTNSTATLGAPATKSTPADGNAIEALAVGNSSTNTLGATAGSSITADAAAATTGASESTAGVLTNQASFALTNAQGSGTGSRSATLTDLGIWLTIGNNVTNSTGQTDANTILASATDNTTSNSLTLDPPSIQATAAIQNFQLSQAALNVTQGKAGIGASAGTAPTPYSFSATPETHDSTGAGASFTDSGTPPNTTYTGWLQTSSATAGLAGWTAGTGPELGSYFLFVTNYNTGSTYAIPGTPLTFSGTYGGTPATAATPGTGVIITVAHAITASTLDNSSNTFNAAAAANNAVNNLTVTAGNAANAAGTPATPATEGALVSSSTGITATGDYALQNLQSQSGSISTTSNATNSIIDTTTYTGLGADNTTGSTLTLIGNGNEASSQGNIGANTVAITATDSTGVTSSLLSLQSSTAATTGATANQVVASNLLVSNSQVTESTNTNEALATNNTATNSLSAGGGASLGSGYGGPATGAANAGSNPVETGASADYAVANLQSAAAGTTSATASQSVGNSDAAGVATGTGSVNGGSTITLDSNSNEANATANLESSSLTLNPSASLAADAGLLNTQTSSDSASAHVGTTGAAGTTVSFVEPNVQSSTVDISLNFSSAEAMGNVATANTISASAADIQLTGAIAVDPGAQDATAGQTGANADYALANLQNAAGTFTAVNNALFSISETIPTAGATVETTNATLTVDGNIAQAAAEVNSAGDGTTPVNLLTITAGADAVNGTSPTHAPTGALLSVQTATPTGSGVTAYSVEGVNATGIVSDSTVDMSSNTNLALSIGNTATNELNASATNYASAGNNGYGNLYAVLTPTTISADLSVENNQSVTGVGLTSTANTTIAQSDTTAAGGTAAVDLSTVTIDSNKTTAASTVNNASNTLDLTAANTGAQAGVVNDQSSAVSSTSAANVSIGYAEPSATTSTVTLDTNSSSADATGNLATNALNATASANYSIPTGSFGSTNNTTPTAHAQYAVLNDQTNTGSISSTNTTTVSLALNGAGAGVVTNSELSASNNSVLAQSTGNSAANSIALSAAVTGTAPTALSSLQSNTGGGTSISATVTGSFAEVTSGGIGSTTGSTIAVNGNTFVARSTGNSVVNTITAK